MQEVGDAAEAVSIDGWMVAEVAISSLSARTDYGKLKRLFNHTLNISRFNSFQKTTLHQPPRKVVAKPPTLLNAGKRQFIEILETVEPRMLNEVNEPEPKRHKQVVQKAVPLKQTTIPNLIVIQQERQPQQATHQKATPQKTAAQKASSPPKRGPSENTNVAPKPRILNQSASAQQFKVPDIVTKEDGVIELILEQNDETGSDHEPEQVDVFPCTECDRTFLLQQMLDLHMVNHKRERCSECDYCSKKFFSKADLAKHMRSHADVKPFQCTVCDKGFTRSNLLSRHEKTHTDLLHFECSFCSQTFLQQDDLEKHETKHRLNRPFACSYCDKSFAFKQGLERHEVKHLADQPFKCEYCEEGYPSAASLARHLVQHAGRRPFPCRFCTKSYLLSHHLTRHVRSHMNSNSTFICNYCPESFDSLNQLIAHSTVHLKGECICPLCKEILNGPDELAAHIESHSGEQFACEFCDLIFAQEELKDLHCEVEHEDEQAEYDNDTRSRLQKKSGKNESVEIDFVNEQDEEEPQNDVKSDDIRESTDDLDTRPRRGRPPKAKPNILNKNYSNNTSKPLESVQTVARNQAKGKVVAIKQEPDPVNEPDDSMEYEFDYVDVIQKDEVKKKKVNTPPVAKKPPATVQPKKVDPSPSNPRKSSISPVKKLSPIKHVPIAQQKLEQQLQNAMKKNSPQAQAKSNSSNPPTPTVSGLPNKPILTKVNFKKLPPGVTVKKVNAPPTKSPAKPQTPVNTYTKKTPAPSPAPSPAAKPPMQRVKMTQAQVDQMAKEGKIQMKNGQVFLRNPKPT